MPQTMTSPTLAPELLHRMDAYWRAANYLSVGQIYLYDNPLEDILIEHKQYIAKHGEDLPEIRNWKWRIAEPSSRPAS
jgi:phosphoketolase